MADLPGLLAAFQTTREAEGAVLNAVISRQLGQIEQLVGAHRLGLGQQQAVDALALGGKALAKLLAMRSSWLSRVVFPAPRKPDSTVTGRRGAFMGSGSVIPVGAVAGFAALLGDEGQHGGGP